MDQRPHRGNDKAWERGTWLQVCGYDETANFSVCLSVSVPSDHTEYEGIHFLCYTEIFKTKPTLKSTSK